MNRKQIEKLIHKIVDEKLEELQLEEFAQDTADIVIDIKHQMEDLEDKIK